MNCDKYQQQISASLDGCLSPEETAELRAHMESCSDCRAFAETIGDLSSMMRAETQEMLPSATDDAIRLHTLGLPRGRWWHRLFGQSYRIPRPVAWLGGLALIVLTINTIVGTGGIAPSPPRRVQGDPHLAQVSEDGVRTIHLTEDDVVYRQQISDGGSNE